MSTDYNVYVGPYIRVANPKKPHKIEVKCCNKKGCNLFQAVTKNNFCPSCGSPIKSITKSDNRRIEASGWADFNDKLFLLGDYIDLRNEEIFIPVGGVFGKTLNLCYDGGVIDSEENTATIQRFKDYYKLFIEKIQEMYKETPVVKYGVIAYTS